MARQGRPESEVRIWEDDVWRLVLPAYQKLGMIVARDPKRRGILTVIYDIELTNGIMDLSGAGFDALLREGLRYSSFFDADDQNQLRPYIFKDKWQDLLRWLNPEFGYYALRNNSLITRQRGVEDVATALTATPGGAGNPAKLIAPSVPTATVPTELEDEAVAILAAMATAPADEIAAHVV